MKHWKWNILPLVSAEQIEALFPLPGLDPLMAQLLHNRHLSNPDEARRFFAPDEALLHDPFLLNDMDKAVECLNRSIISNEVIAVYGDYDVDGITSIVLLEQVLRHLGGRTCAYIPHRFEEGYGLNKAGLKSLADRGVKLVVTVDCGANAVAEVDYARSLGMDMIISDHHTIGDKLPRAIAEINPKRSDSTYPFRDLAGVGVAFKLAQALLRVKGGGRRVEGPALSTLHPPTSTRGESDLLDLVALGTVADMAPLVGENRYLVKRGLEVINSTTRVGVQQMIALSGLKSGRIDAEAIGYTLGPRLNAAGRLDSAAASYDLLSTDDVKEAERLAEVLEVKNAERQRLTNKTYAAALEALPSQIGELDILVASGRDFSMGLAGLVAGKLADHFYKPAVIIEEGDELCRGSARSIPGFNIVDALSGCRDRLVRFGGHAQAAGFTLKTTELPRFKEELAILVCEALGRAEGGEEIGPTLDIEAEVPLTCMNQQLYDGLLRLSPFGMGNPTPVFLSRQARVVERRQVGNQKDHLRLRLSDGTQVWTAIGFGLGRLVDSLSDFVDIVYTPEESVWKGVTSIQLRIIDLHASGE
ncbi:MAG: single-stranded-DNA-specific exonuclease RecJ [Dehalococcoidia bacterium]|nr:single-stranded-DNA-specific exonuclease RecJ [Dehalococcoidia bacterium]